MKDDRKLPHGETEANKDEGERLSQQRKFVPKRLKTSTLDDFLASFEPRGGERLTRLDAGIDDFNAEIERQVKRGKTLPPRPRDPDASRFATESTTPPQKSRVQPAPPSKPTPQPIPKPAAAPNVGKPTPKPAASPTPQTATKPAPKPVAAKTAPTTDQETPRFIETNSPSATATRSAKKPAPRFDSVTGKPLDPNWTRQIEALRNQNPERRFDPQTGKPILPAEEEPEIFLEEQSAPVAKKKGGGGLLFLIFLVAIVGSNYGPLPAIATFICGVSLFAMINSIKKL